LNYHRRFLTNETPRYPYNSVCPIINLVEVKLSYGKHYIGIEGFCNPWVLSVLCCKDKKAGGCGKILKQISI
jgi:hypothetical protein